MLDGKYEITSERELDARTTLFIATAPDGTALRITWYDLSGPEEEHDFEGYRLLLRQLRREGYAAIYDLVARPGAHYVAWHVPPEAGTLPELERLAAIESILERHGTELGERAHLRRPKHLIRYTRPDLRSSLQQRGECGGAGLRCTHGNALSTCG